MLQVLNHGDTNAPLNTDNDPRLTATDVSFANIIRSIEEYDAKVVNSYPPPTHASVELSEVEHEPLTLFRVPRKEVALVSDAKVILSTY